jgi:hypothetical protein
MPQKKDHNMMFRCDADLASRFTAAIETDNLMHGFQERTMSVVFREFMREFTLRVESTAESAAGRQAAEVLKRGAKRVSK